MDLNSSRKDSNISKKMEENLLSSKLTIHLLSVMNIGINASNVSLIFKSLKYQTATYL